MASIMCHVFIVAITSDYGDRLRGKGLATERVNARLEAPVEHPKEAPAHILLPRAPEPAKSAKPADRSMSADYPKVAHGMLSSPAQSRATADTEAVSAYVPAELLSVKPRILDEPETILPADLATDEHGSVIVQLLVNTEGGVDSVLVQSSELSTVGTRQFIQRLSSLHLEPGQLNGVASKALYRLEFTVQAAVPERRTMPR
ncbi:hypothetical protein [Uliginosibacterium gangwonense]|uniref:hypothetical protein n=1 Tax=Uliginosibacterium gangwonense TaxID=392736 RepID=UPI0012F81914|nr:hypothetical protein [Uliginosibacterium gangwonense]